MSIRNNNVVSLQFGNVVEAERVEVENKNVISNQSNPIYTKMLAFHHSKVGDKFSLRDLLR